LEKILADLPKETMTEETYTPYSEGRPAGHDDPRAGIKAICRKCGKLFLSKGPGGMCYPCWRASKRVRPVEDKEIKRMYKNFGKAEGKQCGECKYLVAVQGKKLFYRCKLCRGWQFRHNGKYDRSRWSRYWGACGRMKEINAV
jgi:hypothetical protein